MEGLAPPLQLIHHLRYCLEGGESTRSALISYLDSENDDFVKGLKTWFVAFQVGRDLDLTHAHWMTSPHRKVLLDLIRIGLEGQPIYSHLCELEQEVLAACKDEIEEYLNILPMKVLVVLLLFQFPAFLLLLFGPLLHSLLIEIQKTS